MNDYMLLAFILVCLLAAGFDLMALTLGVVVLAFELAGRFLGAML